MTAGPDRALKAALDRASDRGAAVRVWWRDDDAVRATPALDRLLALAREAGTPLAIAAVPSGVEPSLPERLRDEADVSVLVHGLTHRNHAPPDAKRAEFGPGRDVGTMLREARRGWALARDSFGPRALPVFVPPWNRIAPALASRISEAGYRAVSGFGAALEPGARPFRVDTHLDPVDWRGGRGPIGPDRLGAALASALPPGGDAPLALGLLTHHLAFDDALWGWCEDALALLSGHPAVRFAGIGELLASATEPSRPRHLERRWGDPAVAGPGSQP